MPDTLQTHFQHFDDICRINSHSCFEVYLFITKKKKNKTKWSLDQYNTLTDTPIAMLALWNEIFIEITQFVRLDQNKNAITRQNSHV